ncbi:MAG: ribonuclease Z [Taibaiella sp.]|nr:ribonuclease Z [Taibaiella sp.]
MKITILGNNSAIPAHGRNPSAQIAEIKDFLLLIDCGEGTQMQMIKYGIKRSKIRYILISHLHGDHYFGLIGLINSFGLLGRTDPLHIYCPELLPAIIQAQLDASSAQLPYELHFHTIADSGERRVLVEDAVCRITCFPVDHRIATHGFVITEKAKARKLDLEACRQYEIPQYFYKRLQAGEDYEQKDGTIVQNEWVTLPGLEDKVYAYCADTRHTLSFVEDVAAADLIYHESTYLDADADLAILRYHSTAVQAAELAQASGAKRLMLGHYSSRYKEIEAFEAEAKRVFPNTVASFEGMEVRV